MRKDQPYGIDLAEKIYNYLQEGNSISFNHYGYCGVGFVSEGNIIHYTHFDEWLTWTTGRRYESGGAYLGIIDSFKSKKAFIDWLAMQSDTSLSGIETGDDWYIDNQRVTKARLERCLRSQNA